MLIWSLFLSKTSCRAVVMKLKAEILYFESRHIDKPLVNPVTNKKACAYNFFIDFPKDRFSKITINAVWYI